MALTQRLYQFNAKSTLIPADIIYAGDSTNTFNEVQTTVAGIIGAYSNLMESATFGNVAYSSITLTSTAGIIGTTTNDSANAGSVGELNSIVVLSGAAVSLTTATPANVASLVLQPGDYDVWGELWTLPNGATITTSVAASLNTTSATLATVPSVNTSNSSFNVALGAGVNLQLPLGACRISVATATTTTVYLCVNAAFTTNTLAAYGKIMARRRR